ncbi:hypothetical protein ALC57_10399, partial [Trachymyrmex cornetzi]
GRSNENARECGRLYALRFPNRRHLSRQTISNLIARARDGRLRRQRKKKDRTENTMLNIAILGMVAFNPHVSQRKISLELSTSLFTVNRVLRTTTRENMMERITLACRDIPRNILLSTVNSFERRVRLCVDNNGQIFEHLLRS